MTEKKPKRPRDANQLAKMIVDMATGESEEQSQIKNVAAVFLGRSGGLKGGPARAAILSPGERSEIAKKAAQARWKKASKTKNEPSVE